MGGGISKVLLISGKHRLSQEEVMSLVPVSEQELMEIEAGVVLTASFVAATVVWAVNAGLLWYGIRDLRDHSR